MLQIISSNAATSRNFGRYFNDSIQNSIKQSVIWWSMSNIRVFQMFRAVFFNGIWPSNVMINDDVMIDRRYSGMLLLNHIYHGIIILLQSGYVIYYVLPRIFATQSKKNMYGIENIHILFNLDFQHFIVPQIACTQWLLSRFLFYGVHCGMFQFQ